MEHVWENKYMFNYYYVECSMFKILTLSKLKDLLLL